MSHKDFNQRSLADSLVTDHKALHDFDDIDKLINWQKIKEQLAGIHNKKCGNCTASHDYELAGRLPLQRAREILTDLKRQMAAEGDSHG